MPVTFNPFNPFMWWPKVPQMPAPSRPVKGASEPIAIEGRASDPGIRLAVDAKNGTVTLRGTARGPLSVQVPPYGGGDYARSVAFSLDLDKAPTVDRFGRTNYSEKNSRYFTVMTQQGWSAEECARRLAAKVNAGDDFRASVSVAADGTATLRFTRR